VLLKKTVYKFSWKYVRIFQMKDNKRDMISEDNIRNLSDAFIRGVPRVDIKNLLKVR
jgi:hypothetical protein